jgi:hypothetical protein
MECIFKRREKVATDLVIKAGSLALVRSGQNVAPTFEEVLAPFKEKAYALDNAEVARAVLEGVGKFTSSMVVDPTDGMRYYFNGLALPQELMESLGLLDGYVKQQTSHAAIEQLKKDVKAFEKEFTGHVQEKFKSCDDLLVIARQLEASGQKQAAVHAFYAASLKALEDSEPEKLELAVSKIEELDPTMGSLDLQQRTQLKAQMTIIDLERQLAVSKAELEPLKKAEETRREEEARLKAIAEEYGFGPENWARYFGDVGQVPPLPSKIEEILAGPCPYWEGRHVRDTHMLVLVPATVNGEPFTLNHLGEMIQEPKEGHATKYGSYGEGVRKEIGDRAPEQPYWVLMTKDVVPGSLKKIYEEHSSILKESYRPPRTLEVVTALLMHYVRTEAGQGSIHTWCEEKVEQEQLFIGCFSLGELNFYSFGDFRLDNNGLVGVRKLF